MSKRARVVAAARTWLGTPFHHHAQVRGAGVDCLNLLAAVYTTCGLIEPPEIPDYTQDWHIHHGTQRFLDAVLRYADLLPEGETPQPGDIVMFVYGRHAAHGAIVVDWPVVIHAWRDVGQVVMTEADTGPLAARFAGAYRMRGIDA